MKEKNKEIAISFAAIVDADVKHEEIAERISEAMKPLADKVKNVSDVSVRTVPRVFNDHMPNGAYETRIWEKATCKSEAIHNPLDDIAIPRFDEHQVMDKVNMMSRQIEELQAQLKELQKKIHK